MPAFSIRPLSPHDDVAMAAIFRAVMPEFGAAGPAPELDDPEVLELSACYSKPRSTYLVVTDESGRVLGGGGIAELEGGSSDVCELRKMYFLPELRGHGMGRALLERLLALAPKLGFRRVYLETRTGMHAAQGLYEACGFRRLSGRHGNTQRRGCDRYYEREL